MISIENNSETPVTWGGLEFAAHEKRVISDSDLLAIQCDADLAIALFEEKALVYLMGELAGAGRVGYLSMMRYTAVLP